MSLSIFFVAICAVVVNVVIVAKNIRYNQELTQEKERIEKDLGNSDDDVYDICGDGKVNMLFHDVVKLDV